MSDIVKINYNGKLLKEVKQSSSVTMLTKGKKMKGDVVIESELGDAVLEPTTITESGEYTVEPPSGVNGFSKVDVAVPRLTLTEEDENKVVGPGEDPGTYELHEQGPYPDVIVHSGQYDTTMYNSVEVDVPQPELGTKYIEENGGYNAFDEGYDGYSEVTVNVENTYTEDQVGMMVKEVEPEHYELTTPSIGPVPVDALGEYSIYPGDHDRDAFDQIDVRLPAGPLTITSAENQTYTPQEGVAFTEVTVDLPPITDLSATSNGTYLARDYHTEEGEPILGWNMVEVDVAPQLEPLEIRSPENTRYFPEESDGFTFVDVNLPPVIDKTITENGTYYAEEDNCLGYGSVNVDVEPPHVYHKTITENGEYRASDDGYYGYSDVDVMVENTYTDEQAGMMVKPEPSGEYTLQSPNFISCEITENGEYSPDKFDPDADAIMYINVDIAMEQFTTTAPTYEKDEYNSLEDGGPWDSVLLRYIPNTYSPNDAGKVVTVNQEGTYASLSPADSIYISTPTYEKSEYDCTVDGDLDHRPWERISLNLPNTYSPNDAGRVVKTDENHETAWLEDTNRFYTNEPTYHKSYWSPSDENYDGPWSEIDLDGVPNVFGPGEVGMVVEKKHPEDPEDDTVQLVQQDSLSIDANGEYDTTSISSVAVQISNTYSVEDEGKVVRVDGGVPSLEIQSVVQNTIIPNGMPMDTTNIKSITPIFDILSMFKQIYFNEKILLGSGTFASAGDLFKTSSVSKPTDIWFPFKGNASVTSPRRPTATEYTFASLPTTCTIHVPAGYLNVFTDHAVENHWPDPNEYTYIDDASCE